jgi:hypothetical protein
MRSGKEANRRSVFLNVPFDPTYEPLFIALISVLVALGRVPRSVLEAPERGDGRLVRILNLIRSCPVSIHDLSRVELPARFNMPFELGIAFALSRIERRHKFILLEAKRHRLQQTLSDVNGIDPGIHGATIKGVISCALDRLGKPYGNPDLKTVARIHRQLWKITSSLKRTHGRTNIYSRSIFGELVAGANRLARKEGLISLD